MTLPRSTSLAALAVLLVACAGQPAVELDVAPAGATDEVADPAPPAEPTTPAPVEDTADETTGTSDAGAEPAAEPRATTAPSGGTSAEPTPLSDDPELVIGEDGCVTDVATGLVVTCHDPAAGPDDS